MSDIQRAEISLNGYTGKVVVGGHDLSHAVQGLTLRAGVDEIPSLELELCIPIMEVAGEMDVEVFMPEQTKKALIALGWAPPAEEETGGAA